MFVAGLFLAGCATSFTGSAHIEGGRAGCDAKCRGQGMATVGLVYMGEYSSACVCQVPGQAPPLALSAGAAVAGGVAGVEMQRQNMENQRTYGN